MLTALSLGSLAQPQQQQERNDATNSNRSSSKSGSQPTGTDTVIDVDGIEYGVLMGGTAIAFPEGIGISIGVGEGVALLNPYTLLGAFVLVTGLGILIIAASQGPIRPNAASNTNYYSKGKRNLQNEWTDKAKQNFGRDLKKICDFLREAYSQAKGVDRLKIKAAQKFFGCRSSSGGGGR
jgi:hypothetical protein